MAILAHGNCSPVLLATIILGLIKASAFLFNPKKKPFNNRAYRYTIGTFTSLAVITLVIMAIMVGTSFSARQTVSATKTLELTGVDTLTVSAFNPVLSGFYEGRRQYYSFNYNPFRTKIRYLKSSTNAIKNDSLWFASKLEIRESTRDYWELEVIRWSHGADDYQAKMYAELIPVDYTLINGRLVFNTHYYPGDDIPFRDQQLE
ncbi:MAG TPA: hypothetical protein VEC12_01970, partial [Bacteroidia bacterium]|nr:hypothetical protein [Bacteroidia bacterium]